MQHRASDPETGSCKISLDPLVLSSQKKQMFKVMLRVVAPLREPGSLDLFEAFVDSTLGSCSGKTTPESGSEVVNEGVLMWVHLPSVETKRVRKRQAMSSIDTKHKLSPERHVAHTLVPCFRVMSSLLVCTPPPSSPSACGVGGLRVFWVVSFEPGSPEMVATRQSAISLEILRALSATP